MHQFNDIWETQVERIKIKRILFKIVKRYLLDFKSFSPSCDPSVWQFALFFSVKTLNLTFTVFYITFFVGVLQYTTFNFCFL